ncbi:hypothetical protein [uncultured Kordia sp.]|uniref:hypothetical protein n=1 Tax=uncultured Kordia sp. TaxID=507699 RepID=UPI00261FDA57|nr:hypothetical protein [uncultured Kordia sp.]
MNINRLLLIACLILSQLVFSQDQSEKIDKDIIKFTNGNIKEGKVDLYGIYNPKKNRKIQLCDNNYKNCKEYKLSNIDNITIIRDFRKSLKGMYQMYPNLKSGERIDITKKHYAEFKILYNPKKGSDTPLASKLIFKGENHNYYSFNGKGLKFIFNTSGPNGNTLGTSYNHLVFVTEKGSNFIKYKFQHKTNKKTLKTLKKLFSNCNGIIAESKKKNKEIKKKPLVHFLKILDKCL